MRELNPEEVESQRKHPRRWRWFGLPKSLISDLLDMSRTGLYVKLKITETGKESTVPIDFHIVGDVEYDWERRLFKIRVWSSQFDIVSDGAITPYGGNLVVYVQIRDKPE